MGYTGTKNRMHCYQRLPKKDVPLMESEKIKGGDSSLPVTYMLSDGCDPVLSTGSPEATEFIRMSHVSEEGVEEEEEENEEGQEEEEELTFLLVMDQDQIWDNLCDPVEGERSERLERGWRDPENWAERKSSPNLPGNNSEDVSLNCHREELAAASSQSVHQPSLFNSSTLALAPGVIAGKGQLSVGLPQALNVHDVSPQTQCEETLKTNSFLAQAESTYECCQESRDISKSLQNAESSKPRSDEDLPLHPETSHEKEKGLLVVIEAPEEMSSKMEGTGRMDPCPSTEKKVRELKEQGEDVKPFADQPSSESPEGNRRKVVGVETTPNGILPLLSSKEVDNYLGLAVKVEDLEQNIFFCSDQQLREEDDTEEGRAGSSTETKPAESHRDGGEVELAQEWLMKTVASEPAEMEVVELGDTELDGEEDLDWKEMEKEMKMEQERLLLGADGHEGQEMQAQKTSNGGTESETAAPAFMLGLDITFPHKELFASDSSLESACAECCIQTSVAEQMPSARPPAEGLSPASESPRAQSPTCQGQWKYSGIYCQAGFVPCSGQDFEQLTEGGRKDSVEEECSENDGDGKCSRRVNGEGTAPFSRDLLLTLKSQNLNDFQGMNLPVDGEIRILASPLETVTVAGLQQKDACKSDGTVGYVVLHEEPDSNQELPKQNVPLPCQLNKTVSGEASAFSSDATVQSAHKKDISSQDSHERAQDSASEVLQSVLPEEGLEEESIEPSLTVQDETWDPAQDRAMDKFQKHLKPSVRNFVFPGKEAEEDLFCTKQEILISELPWFLGPDENRAENKHNPSPDRGISTATDTVQLTKTLTLGPDLDHVLDSELPSSHLHQTSSPPLDCRHSLPFIASLPDRDFLAQPPDPDMDPTHPSQILEQLPSSCPSCPFLSLKPVSTQMPQSAATTSAIDQPPASESGFHPCCQLPDCACHSKQSLPLEDDVVPVLPPKHKHFVFPALHTNQGSQTLPSGQSGEAEALELHTSPPAVFPWTTEPQNLPLNCHYSKSPAPGSKLFAQQQAEATKSSLPVHCREANGHARTHVPIASSTSQDTPPALESQHFKSVLNTDGGVEGRSLVQLAELQEGNAPQDQKHNVQEASSNLEVNVLGTHSNLVTLNNDACIVNPIYGVLEPTARVPDMPDGTTPSDLISVESHTPEVQDSVRPPVLAFTNPIHFLQLGPPSPPTARHPYRQQTVFHGSQWRQQQQQTDSAKIDAGLTSASVMMLGVAEVAGKFRKGLEKPMVETIPAEVQRKEGLAKHQPLEKSSSCPPKNVIRQDMKVSETNSRKQEVLLKLRSKSKDWHRQGLRKVSISTDHALAEAIASLVPSKEEVPAYREKREHSDQVTYGEKKPAETFDVFLKRRCSKLIHSSELLYQKYSDDALNKAIQNQKRAGSVPEDVELGSPNSPRLRRKGLHSQDSYLHRLSVSSSTSLWQDIPMVRGSTMLLSMTHEEQKLQEAKFELIASEASYLRSLNVAVDHFQCSHVLQAVLNNQEKQWLFSRLPDVRDVSANFLFDLEEKLEENMFNFNVCDVALRHAPEFRRVYLPYVTNQTYQQQTFRRLLNDVPAFQQVLEKLESDPVCQRLSLKSFLILPFQRITRLKLLLQNILKRTPPGADEEMQATQAYDALEKLIKDCNENVQRMKSTEELIYLSQNMEFECKIFPLISQSRRLIKCGELTALEYNISLKWKLTTRPIYLHLFNDYLLLSRPRENGRFIVFDYAASSDVRGEKCEMKLHGANKNVFRLFLLQNSQGKKVEFLFRTDTQSEKLRWISALAPRQAELDLLDDSDALQVQCVKPYKARENDELALEKADIIMVLQQSSDGWSEGIKLSDGERGWFPSEQVEPIASKEARQINLKEQLRVKKAKQQVFHRR